MSISDEIVVERALPADAPVLATIQRLAFANDPIDLNLFSAVPAEIQDAHVAEQIAKYMLPDSNKIVFKATRGGKVVGVSAWYLPKLSPAKADPPPTFAEGSNQELAQAFFAKFDLGVTRPHYYLALLVIDPSAQGLGVGRALLAPGLSLADKDGREVYLHSSEIARPIYKRYGFKEFGGPVEGFNGESRFAAHPMRRTATISLGSARVSDLPELAALYRESLSGSAYFDAQFGKTSPEAHDAVLVRAVEKALSDEAREHGSELVVARRGGQIVGWAQFERRLNEGELLTSPEPLSEEAKAAAPARKPPVEGMNFELFTAVGEAMAAHRKTLSPGEYIHLRTVVTSPSAKRSGVGRKLVEYALNAARSRSIPLRLYSTEEGVALYESLGMTPGEVISAPGDVFKITPFSVDAPSCAFVPAVVVPATEEDLARIGEMHQAAFAPSAMYRACWGACVPSELATHFAGSMSRYLKPENISEGFELVLIKRGQQTIGFSLMQTCTGFRPAPQKDAPARRPPAAGTNVQVADDFFTRLHKMEERIQGSYFFFHIIVCAPEFQKTGAARAVLEYGLKKAEDQGLDAYLDATPEGYPVYTRFGFVRDGDDLVGTGDIPFTGTPMKRALPNARPPIPPTDPNETIVSLATPLDIPRLAELHHAAFSPGDWYQALRGKVDREDFIAWQARRLLPAISREAHEKGYHLVCARRGGQVVAYGLMHDKEGEKVPSPDEEAKAVNEAAKEEEKKPQRPSPTNNPPTGTNVEMQDDYGRQISLLGERLKFTPHVSLYVLATDPAFARTGGAKKVVEYAIKLADAKGLDVYLDSTTEGLPFYTKLGFVQDAPIIYGLGNAFASHALKRKFVPASALAQPKPVVVPAGGDDLDRLVDIHYDSFSSTKGDLYDACWGKCDPLAFKAYFKKALVGFLSPKCQKEGYQLVCTKRGDQIVGYSVIQLHSGVWPTEKDEEDPQPEGTDLRVQGDFFSRLHAMQRRIKGPYVFFHIIATDPKLFRTGSARAILEYGIKLGDERGLDCYMDASQDGYPVYSKAGFSRDGEDLVALDALFYGTPMKRPLHRPTPKRLAPPTVELATAQDLAKIGALYRAAFVGSPTWLAFWGACEPVEVGEYVERFIAKDYAAHVTPEDQANGHHLVVAKRESVIVGYAHIQLQPTSSPASAEEKKEDQEEEGESWPEGTDLETLNHFFSTLGALQSKETQPRVHIHAFAVAPEAQRTGVAQALLEYATALAEKEKVPISLDSTAAGLPTYEKAGFVRSGEDYVALGDKFRSTPMRREVNVQV